MALLADCFAQCQLQSCWIDDVVLLRALRMQLAGAMAALAADGVAVEYGLLIAVARSFNGLHAVGMAIQALCSHQPACARRASKAGREVPNPLLRKPAHSSLKDIAVTAR